MSTLEAMPRIWQAELRTKVHNTVYHKVKALTKTQASILYHKLLNVSKETKAIDLCPLCAHSTVTNKT